MKKKAIQHQIDGLAALLLFGVFAVCVLAVLLTGADAYRRLTQRDQAAFDRRSCTQYIATKVRQSDRAGNLAVKDIGGVQALIMDAEEEYVTYLYCYDGWLWELFAWAGEPPVPGEGQQLLEAERVGWSLEDGLLTVEITAPGGAEDTLLLSLRGGEGADA